MVIAVLFLLLGVPLALGCAGTSCSDPVPQCPAANWHYLSATDRCYASVYLSHVWTDANDFCRLRSGNLPIVPNAFANNAVVGLAQKYTLAARVPYTAIGLHDPGKNGTWVWTDGQTFTYSNWEKKPKPSDGYCAFMCTNASECRVGTWKAMSCDDQKKADMNQLCQRRPYMR